MRDGKVVGYDIELAAMFCEYSGYGLDIIDMNFDGILPAIQTSKCDFALAGISITPERAESVLFSKPNFSGGTVAMILKENAEYNDSFWDSISESFNKTFIRENRWQLFQKGILTTLLITIFAVLFGTALGFVVFMLCRNGNPVANIVTQFFMWLIQGMPMVVLLMILFYVIFGSVAINGVLVAIIGFSLTFGASVFGLLKTGVGAVGIGQYEGAYALGYSERQTFYKIILPQAMPFVLPAYKGEIVSLIKSTAIVGYIAVQDLTKIGDIVRGRTYEAFFPLISITVIYFALETLVGFGVGRISVNINPKRRKESEILKGIKH
jgi:polar amino acid transport system substrate-binding protein